MAAHSFHCGINREQLPTVNLFFLQISSRCSDTSVERKTIS